MGRLLGASLVLAAMLLPPSEVSAFHKKDHPTGQLVVGPLSKEACERLRAVFAQWDKYGETLVNQGAIDRDLTWAQVRQARAGCK